MIDTITEALRPHVAHKSLSELQAAVRIFVTAVTPSLAQHFDVLRATHMVGAIVVELEQGTPEEVIANEYLGLMARAMALVMPVQAMLLHKTCEMAVKEAETPLKDNVVKLFRPH